MRNSVRRGAFGRGAMRRTAGRRAAPRVAAVRGAAVRHRPVGHAAIWVPAVRPAGARRSTRRRTVGDAVTEHAVTGHAAVARDAVRRSGARGDSARGDSARRDTAGGDSARGKPAWLARARASGLAEPLLPGRHLARAAQQLPVIVFLGVYRSARPGRIVLLGGGWVAVIGRIGSRAIATAIPLAPGDTVRVTAEAGVATFHQIPPGPWCPATPRDICPYLLSVGRQKSPV